MVATCAPADLAMLGTTPLVMVSFHICKSHVAIKQIFISVNIECHFPPPPAKIFFLYTQMLMSAVWACQLSAVQWQCVSTKSVATSANAYQAMKERAQTVKV